jgi:hypothetical protein
LEILLPLVGGDLLLDLLLKVRMIPQAFEVLRKLTVPVGKAGSVEKVVHTPKTIEYATEA